MSFRPATTADEEFFWYWRERAEREPWYGGQKTNREQHGEWFRDRLGRITLLVWYYKGRPAGAVRIDSNGEVAFSCNELLGDRLLRDLAPFASNYGGRLKVTLDAADKASARSLKAAGFREYPVKFFALKP